MLPRCNVPILALAYCWNEPKLALTAIFALCSNPIFALTSLVFAIHKLPEMPTPPTTTRAPVLTLVLVVPEAATMLPSTVSVVVIISLYS